jgi:hypothetical protein
MLIAGPLVAGQLARRPAVLGDGVDIVVARLVGDEDDGVPNRRPDGVPGVAERRKIRTEEARAGSTPHIVRYVLGISLFLSIVGLILVWLLVGPSQLP